MPSGNATGTSAAMPRLWCDFNDITRDGYIETVVRHPVSPGTLVVMADYEGNLMEATIDTVTPIPDTPRRVVRCKLDRSTWVNSDTAAALALAWVRQPNRATPAWPGMRAS